jgi:hypothetical protein
MLTARFVRKASAFSNSIVFMFLGSNSNNGPDSNGSGKSSLAMATLWALTGSLDARRSLDLKVADVVNDYSKVSASTICRGQARLCFISS